VAAFGRIDILVNAHTLVGSVALTETSAREWDEVQSVNLRGAFLCMREAIKRMLVQGGGGRIVNVTTIGSLHPVLNGNAAYSSSKAALNMLTKNAALDYAGDGILVNAVLPGAVTLDDATPRFGAAIKSGPGTDKARHLSGGSKPDAVAPAVLFLAGPGGAYITGQLLALDGGFLVS
jgi:NAD(P)-dependent dehydrogenase (short-subunit alcohol dehydrogenase family)